MEAWTLGRLEAWRLGGEEAQRGLERLRKTSEVPWIFSGFSWSNVRVHIKLYCEVFAPGDP